MAEKKLISRVMEEEEAACLHAFQYQNCHMVSMVLQTAVELDVFGIIASAGPEARLSAGEIASRMTTTSEHPGEMMGQRLDGVLRLLVTHAFLKCYLRRSVDGKKEERVYEIAPPAKFYMGSPDQGSLAPRLQLSNHPSRIQLASRLKEAILEGGSQFERNHGVSFYQFYGADPIYNKTFNDSMVAITALTMRKILEVYKGFEGLNSIVDVGGGTGQTMRMIASKYPSINCINFDMPHVIKTAPSYQGVEHVEGDMFVSVPRGDCILLKNVLHNWDDKHCVKLLKNCCEALPEKGKVIVISMRRDDLPDSNMSSRCVAEIDFTMQLLFTSYERNEKELEDLSKASGYSSARLVCTANNIWNVVEVLK